MAYIGRGTDNISNVEVLDNITFTGASSYTLQKGGANYVPVSANNILVSIDGVVQANNFSVSGSTIDFGVAIANTSTCNFVLHFGTGLITTVQDGAITTVKIGDDAVTYAKLQNLATANRVLGSTSTGLIGETQIATDMVSDDAITYAKMQDTSAANRVLGAASAGTIGEVQIATDMIADAQVDESKLKISNTPTNGYVLTAQSGNTGGLTWAEAGGGAFTLISTANVSSGVAQVDITSGIDATYKDYLIKLTDMHPSSDNTRLQFRLFSSHGSPDTGNRYMYGGVGKRADNAAPDHNDTGTNRGEISIAGVGNSTAESASALMWLFNPSGTTYNKNIFIQDMMLDNSGLGNIGITGFNYDAGSVAYTGIRFFFATGNIDTGTISLYGIS